jgi:hypothetical protein
MVDTGTPIKGLPAEIADFYDAIVEKVATLRADTYQSMSQIKKEREELASELEQDLARGESLRKADFQKLIGEVIEMRKARQKEVMDLLAQFQQEEQAVARELKKLFSDGKQARLRDFKKFIADTRRATKTRQDEIVEIAQASMAIRKSAEETIARFREEREELAKDWKALAKTMREKRPTKTTPGPRNSIPRPKSPSSLSRMTDHASSKSTKAKKPVEE